MCLVTEFILFDVQNVQFPLFIFRKANIEMSRIFPPSYFQISRQSDLVEKDPRLKSLTRWNGCAAA